MDTNFRIFQYKLLNNVLYLNNMLFSFKKIDSSLRSYCEEEEETPLNLFYSCLKTKQLWKKLRQYFPTIYKHSTLHSTELHSRNIWKQPTLRTNKSSITNFQILYLQRQKY